MTEAEIEKRKNELYADFLRRTGVDELPGHVRVDPDVLWDLVALHGEDGLDSLVACTRAQIQMPYGRKVDCP